MTTYDGTRTPVGRPVVGVGYRDIWRVPYAARLLGGSLVGRLPTGMAPLAILLGADHGGEERTSAGVLAAVYLVATAVGGPVSAGLVDHYGQRHVLTAGTAVSSTAFLTMAASPGEAWSAAAVAVAGAARPPLDASLRALWSAGGMMPSPAHQRVALALDSGTQEVVYVVSPLLVATIATAASACWALVLMAAVGALGTALFVTTPASRVHGTNSRPAPSGWLGPVRSPRLRVLYAAMVCAGVTIGALTPLAVDASDRFGAPQLAGALPAAVSCGAFLGGLLYGARAWRGTTAAHLVILSAAFAAAWIPLTVAARHATVLSCAVIPGLAMAPLLSAAFVTTSTFAPPGHTTQAHALLVAFLDIGCAIGTAAAGLTHTPLLLPAGAAAAALILTATRRLLTPPRQHRPPHPSDLAPHKEPIL